MKKKAKAKVQFFRDKKGGWRYRVVAANGEVLCQSECYPDSRKDAVRGYQALVVAIDEIEAGRNGKFA